MKAMESRERGSAGQLRLRRATNHAALFHDGDPHTALSQDCGRNQSVVTRTDDDDIRVNAHW